MRGLLTLLLFISHMFASSIDSIKASGNNIDKETWEINIERCYDGEAKSCQIIADSGLKNLDECRAKDECADIGRVYFNLGMIDHSLPFFRKSCDKKNALGCYFIGLYHEGNGDFRIAKNTYDKYCSKSAAIACYSLGNLYFNGNGVRQDYVMAAMLYEKACKYGDKHACFAIASLYQSGDAGQKNLFLSKELYGKSCDLGYQKGCDEYRELNKAGIPSVN